MIKYITHTYHEGQCLSGDKEIQVGIEGYILDEFIIMNDSIICFVNSDIGHKHFAINEDGQGLLRGKLTSSICNLISTQDSKHDDRLNKLFNDEFCQKYKRKDHLHTWLWNNDFYTASIEDLKYIAKLIELPISVIS